MTPMQPDGSDARRRDAYLPMSNHLSSVTTRRLHL
jgi:hypothetical protein